MTNCRICNGTRLTRKRADETFRERIGCLDCNEWLTPVVFHKDQPPRAEAIRQDEEDEKAFATFASVHGGSELSARAIAYLRRKAKT